MQKARPMQKVRPLAHTTAEFERLRRGRLMNNSLLAVGLTLGAIVGAGVGLQLGEGSLNLSVLQTALLLLGGAWLLVAYLFSRSRQHRIAGAMIVVLTVSALALAIYLLPSYLLAFLPLVYIAAVTAVSRGEVHGGRRGIAAFALISLIVVLMGLTTVAVGMRSLAGGILTVALAWRVLPAFWGAYQNPAAGPIRHAIRTGVLSLVLLDAVIGASFGGALYSVLILATGLLATSLARLFAVT